MPWAILAPRQRYRVATMAKGAGLGLGWLLAVAVAGCGDEPDPPAVDPSAPRAEAEPDDAPKPERPSCPEPRVPLAQRMGGTIAEACREAVSDPSAHDPEIDRALGGRWRGEYDSDSAEPVAFTIDLIVVDGILSGSSSEPNTFPYVYGITTLPAALDGEAFASHQVVWLKTYTSGVSHSVLYIGTLDEARKRIEGHWNLGGNRGTFWMMHE